jgi:hypothetical protein
VVNPQLAGSEDSEDLPTLFRPSAPSAGQLPAPPPQIPTLVAYAQICAELRRDPARAAAIRARHGLTDDSIWGAALRYWQGQLNTPALREHWAQLVEQMMQQAPGAKR